ncbi:Carbon monoxide dehydrogenase [Hyphomicrobiales bacterium]|nr:Carbon monoxide dehydrogenase [Hyphomicrobiales bacterium]CAH1691393.1 Carbon monoxide dehydrogenase [Hyphomicrobiales bacterium]
MGSDRRRRGKGPLMKFPDFAYARPATLSEALSLLAEDEDAVPLAGGQSLLTMMAFRLATATRLVDISGLAELAAVDADATTLRIGAAVPHARIEDGIADDALGRFLANAAANIGYRAIRNRGTIGGSLAHADPAADWPTVLAALDAQVELASHEGTRALAITDFVQGEMTTDRAPGELITSVVIPLHPSASYGVHKIARKVGEFASAIAAAVVNEDVVRLSVGIVAGMPLALELSCDPADINLDARLSTTPLYRRVSDIIADGAPDASAYAAHLATIAALHAVHGAASRTKQAA